MSSASRKASKSESVAVLGGDWAAVWMGKLLRDRGIPSRVLRLPRREREPDGVAVYHGNGEYFPKARRIFGESLAESLWALSRESYARAKETLAALAVPFTEGGTEWHFDDTVAREPGLGFSGGDLERALGGGAVQVPADVRLEIEGSFRYRIGEETYAGVVLVSERLDPSLLPFLADKYIPCTLSSFTYPVKERFSIALFNGGADFALSERDGLRLGSFRNLFSDRGVGFHDAVDPVTRKGVEGFFGKRGWAPGNPTGEWLKIASLTCDGLPLVGAVPEAPGVFLAGGFAGKEANFLFAVLPILADAVAGRGPARGLEAFTTKRFL